VFNRIHCSCQIHCSFGRFIGKISWYSSVGISLSYFQSNGFRPVFTEFYRIWPVFLKTDKIGGGRFFSVRRFFKHWPYVGFCSLQPVTSGGFSTIFWLSDACWDVKIIKNSRDFTECVCNFLLLGAGCTHIVGWLLPKPCGLVGSHNILTVGLGNCVYLLNACSSKVSNHG
jgi:hypothetical protein